MTFSTELWAFRYFIVQDSRFLQTHSRGPASADVEAAGSGPTPTAYRHFVAKTR